MKSPSLGLVSAFAMAAAVVAGCGGGFGDGWQPDAAAASPPAQTPPLDVGQVAAAVPVAAEPPAAAPADATPVKNAAGRPQVQVLGIAGAAGSGRVALVAVGTSAPVLLKVGDSIETESLLRIGVDYIVLGGDESSRTIRVGVELDASSAVAAAPAAPVPNAAPPPGNAGSLFAGNRAFEQMLAQRQRRASPRRSKKPERWLRRRTGRDHAGAALGRWA